jgi:hypothetical protein
MSKTVRVSIAFFGRGVPFVGFALKKLHFVEWSGVFVPFAFLLSFEAFSCPFPLHWFAWFVSVPPSFALYFQSS